MIIQNQFNVFVILQVFALVRLEQLDKLIRELCVIEIDLFPRRLIYFRYIQRGADCKEESQPRRFIARKKCKFNLIARFYFQP